MDEEQPQKLIHGRRGMHHEIDFEIVFEILIMDGTACELDERLKHLYTEWHPYHSSVVLNHNNTKLAFQEFDPPKILGVLPTIDEEWNRIVIIDRNNDVLLYSNYVYMDMYYPNIAFELRANAILRTKSQAPNEEY